MELELADEANPILEAVLSYAARGWSVIPIEAGTKKATRK